MILVDNNGVTFTSQSVTDLANWERRNIPYVLWFEPARLSVNLKHATAVRVLAPVDAVQCDFTINESDVFMVLPPDIFKSSAGDLVQNFAMNWSDLWYKYTAQNQHAFHNQFIVRNDKLPDDDDQKLFYQCITLKYDRADVTNYSWAFPLRRNGSEEVSKILYTFYLVCCDENEETVLKNCLIQLKNASGDVIESSIIRVGATFYDDAEELKINARNHGIKLPADICKAFWGSSYEEYNPDKVECNDKLKELLFNYMGIKGECGNYASAEKALKWFGWGDHVELTQLVQLNETVPSLYLNDYFDLFTDISESFKNFRRTTYLTLKSQLRECAGVQQPPKKFEFGFGSEGTYADSDAPMYSDTYEDGPLWNASSAIFDDTYECYRKTDISEVAAAYDYAMRELALKLACLADLYERYFLPVQLNVKSSSVVERVSAAPLKMLSGSHRHVSVRTDLVTRESDGIAFEKTVYTICSEYNNPYVDITVWYRMPREFEWTCMSGEAFLSRGTEVRYRTSVGLEYGANMPYKDTDNDRLYPVTFTVNASEVTGDISEVTHLSILYGGRWYQSSVRILWPAYNFELGTLEYVYEDDEVIDSKYVLPKIHEPDLVLTQNAAREKPGYDVACMSKYDLNIPSAKKNLSYVFDLPEIVDDTYAVDAMRIDKYDVRISGKVDITSEVDRSRAFPGLELTYTAGGETEVRCPGDVTYRRPQKYAFGKQWLNFDYCAYLSVPENYIVKFPDVPEGSDFVILYVSASEPVTCSYVATASGPDDLRYDSTFTVPAVSDTVKPVVLKFPTSPCGTGITLTFAPHTGAIVYLHAAEFICEQLIAGCGKSRMPAGALPLTVPVNIYNQTFDKHCMPPVSGELQLSAGTTIIYYRVPPIINKLSHTIRTQKQTVTVTQSNRTIHRYQVLNEYSFFTIYVDSPATVKFPVGAVIYDIRYYDDSTFAGYPRKLFPHEFTLTVGDSRDISEYFDAYVMRNQDWEHARLCADTLEEIAESFSSSEAMRAFTVPTDWWLEGITDSSVRDTLEIVRDFYACGEFEGDKIYMISKDALLNGLQDFKEPFKSRFEIFASRCSGYVFLSEETIDSAAQEIIDLIMSSHDYTLADSARVYDIKRQGTLTLSSRDWREQLALQCRTAASACGERVKNWSDPSAKYFLSVISKEPLYKLFDEPADYREIGVVSLAEQALADWKKEPRTVTVALPNMAHTECCERKVPTYLFLWNRQRFVPTSEDINGFAKNRFFCDDLVCARVTNTRTQMPFWGTLNADNESSDGRFEFVHNSSESFQELQNSQRSFAESNYVLLERTNPRILNLQPGYYSVKFNWSFRDSENFSVTRDNILYISPQINSRLYRDLR